METQWLEEHPVISAVGLHCPDLNGWRQVSGNYEHGCWETQGSRGVERLGAGEEDGVLTVRKHQSELPDTTSHFSDRIWPSPKLKRN